MPQSLPRQQKRMGLRLKSGFNEGRELGRELGREEAMYQVARSMKERGIDPTSIIACTGLAAEVVAAL